MNEFRGFYHPEPIVPILTEVHAQELQALEKVAIVDGTIQHFIGNVSQLEKPTDESQMMTSPLALREFIRKTASETGSSPWDVAQEIRTFGVNDPEQKRAIRQSYKEKLTYVGDIHGADEDLLDRLTALEADPPEYLIFEGDIIGTKNFETLQRLFYNYLNNHSKNEILKQNPDASIQEILEYSGTKPPEEGFNLRQGFLKIREFELRLAGMNDEEISETLGSLTDEDIVAEIKRYAGFVHYGHYASNLPDEAKKALAAGLQENAQKLLDRVKPLIEKGTKVSMIQGNWDARAPIDFVPGIPEVKPLDPEERLFNPQKFFTENGVDFHSDIATIQTKTSLQILLPFDSIINFPNLPQEKKDELVEQVRNARLQNKTIIGVGHGEPNWQIHNLTNPNAEAPKGEHSQLIAGYQEILGLILPDELIYGHLHDPLTDPEGNKQDPNTKYILQFDDGGRISFLPDVSTAIENMTLATYVPLRGIATLDISTRQRNKKPQATGGNRKPAYVKL